MIAAGQSCRRDKGWDNAHLPLDYRLPMQEGIPGIIRRASVPRDDLPTSQQMYRALIVRYWSRIRDYIRQHGEAALVRVAEQPYQRTWERINRTINLHGATAHIFRHTFATAAAPFLDIKTLQSIMGHADIETTLDRYTHAQEERIRAAGQLLTGKFTSSES